MNQPHSYLRNPASRLAESVKNRVKERSGDIISYNRKATETPPEKGVLNETIESAEKDIRRVTEAILDFCNTGEVSLKVKEPVDNGDNDSGIDRSDDFTHEILHSSLEE